MTRILVVAPGQSFSTIDCFHGLVAGLKANGVEVVIYDTHAHLQVLNALTRGAVMSGVVPPDQVEDVQRFMMWLGAADAANLALDQEVDAVVVINGLLFAPDRAMLMQKLGIPVACFGTEAPYLLESEQQIAPAYTHWFTNERRCVNAFANGHYLAHAWNPEVHTPGAAEPDKAVDAVFVGGGYPERKQLLDGMGIDIRRIGTLWHLDFDDPSVRRNSAALSEGAIPNTETTAWHRSARISLNIHRTLTYPETMGHIERGAAESLGPRAYEIPAVQGFMLCDDDRPEIFDVLGESAATFRAWNSADLERQLRYWLVHPDERERRAQAQYEAIQPHSWTVRARTVLETLLP